MSVCHYRLPINVAACEPDYTKLLAMWEARGDLWTSLLWEVDCEECKATDAFRNALLAEELVK